MRVDDNAAVKETKQQGFHRKVEWDDEHDEPYIQIREDVRLTPIRKTDVDEVLRMFNLPEIIEIMTDWPIPVPRSTAQGFVDNAMARGKWARADLKAGKTEVDGNPFTALRQQSTGKFMGQCGSFLNNGTDPIPIPGDFGKERPWTNAPSDLGYSLLREYRGTGLSIEASKVFLESYYWPMMGMRAIGLTIWDENEVSKAVARQLGAELLYEYDKRKSAERGGGVQRTGKWIIRK